MLCYPLLQRAIVFIGLLMSPLLYAQSNSLEIALLLWRGETVTEHSFKQRLSELGYQVNYTVFNAEMRREHMVQDIRTQLLPNLAQYDYVYTFGTTVSQIAKHYLNERKPQVFSLVFAPVEAKLVDSLAAPDVNISGTTLAVALPKQLDNMQRLLKVKHLGLLFNPRERNALIMRNKILELAADYDLSIVDLSVPAGIEQFYDYLQAIENQEIIVDAVYFLSDSFVTHNAREMSSAFNQLGIPSFGANAPQIKNGVLFGTVANYAKIGRLTAEIVDRHQNGEALYNVPVLSDTQPELLVNLRTAELLGFEVPDGMPNLVFVEE